MVTAYVAEEALSVPFRVVVDFCTRDVSFDVDTLLRSTALLQVTGANGGGRFFHGLVASSEFTRVVGEVFHFRVVLRPSLWLLSLREDVRIFQDLNVQEIIQQLLADAGLDTTTKWDLLLTHEKRNFTVLYRESPLNFIQRLCEDAGILYYFTHTDEGHTLHFCDQLEALDDLGEPVELALGERSGLGSEPLRRIQRRVKIRTTDIALRDFDLNNPLVFPESAIPLGGPLPQPVFDYPGEFTTSAEAKARALVRLRALRHDSDLVEGVAETTSLVPGRAITVGGAVEGDANGEFRVAHMTTSGVQHSAADGRVRSSLVQFRAFPTSAPYFPPLRARRPTITGVQTAVVVGAENQDQSIFVDELGRIKVHFHWDRLQEFDDKASCWIRVSQMPLGGSMILPRVGWEVSVAFLEGNPDRPVVLGRVYNSDNMPPMSLPDAKASGSFTSMSSPGGAGKNEISVGDSGGKQGFGISAQKDFNMSTGFDQTETVGVDDETQVNENLVRSVTVNDSTLVKGNQTNTCGTHSSCKVTGNQTLTVSGNETLNSTGNLLEKKKADRTFEVSGNQILLCNGERTTVTGDLTRNVGAAEIVCTASSMSHDIGTTSTSTVKAVRVHLTKVDHGEVVTGAKSITVAAAVACSTKGDYSATCEGATVRLIGGVMQRKIKGDLSIKGLSISLVGATGKFKGGSSELSLKGGPITLKGGKIVIKGGLIKKAGQIKLG